MSDFFNSLCSRNMHPSTNQQEGNIYHSRLIVTWWGPLESSRPGFQLSSCPYRRTFDFPENFHTTSLTGWFVNAAGKLYQTVDPPQCFIDGCNKIDLDAVLPVIADGVRQTKAAAEAFNVAQACLWCLSFKLDIKLHAIHFKCSYHLAISLPPSILVSVKKRAKRLCFYQI